MLDGLTIWNHWNWISDLRQGLGMEVGGAIWQSTLLHPSFTIWHRKHVSFTPFILRTVSQCLSCRTLRHNHVYWLWLMCECIEIKSKYLDLPCLTTENPIRRQWFHFVKLRGCLSFVSLILVVSKYKFWQHFCWCLVINPFNEKL